MRLALLPEQGDLGLSYTELGPEFIPDALVALEAVVSKNPKWNRFKWFWALNLRRLTNAWHNWSTPITDVVTPLLKAVDLLLEIIRSAEEEGSLEMKAAAAAELGDILHSCEFDKELKNTVGKRGLDAGLDAAKCFDIAMQVEDRGGSNLVRAGKFFRYTRQLKKSEKALKKAVAVKDSSKVHHQLALTLRRMALEEKRRAWQNIKDQPGARRAQLLQLLGPRRGASRQSLGVISWARKRAGDTKMAELERPMKAQMYMSLCREDKHVNEAMHHFNKALMLSHGENGEAAYDLGLMYKALGEYRDALEQFLTIVDIEDEPVNVVRAFEQSGLVKLEMCSREENETAARRLQESGRTLLSMAILVQARIVRDFRIVMGHRDHDIWRSLHSLGQYLHQLDVEGVSKEDSTAELWLLRLLRVYADTAPVLTSLQQYSPRDAEDVQAVGDKLRKYLRDQRHEDAVLFSALLHLTHQGRVLDSGLRDLVLRAHARAARKRLLSDLEEGNAGTTFNACMAKMLFRWAFEDTYPAPDDAHSAHGDAHPAPADGHPASTTDDAHLPQTTADAHPAPADVHPASTTDDVPPASVATEAHLPQTTTDAHQAPANAHEAPASTHLPQSTAEAHPASTINDAPPFPDDAQPTTDDTHPTTDGAHPASTTCDAPPLPDDAHPTTDDANAAHSDELRDEASSLHAAANEDSGQERGSAEAPGNTPLENHVLLIHDPHDPEATHAAQLLRPALQTTYGLRAGLAEQDSSEVMMRTTLGAMSRARLLLFILGSAGT